MRACWLLVVGIGCGGGSGGSGNCPDFATIVDGTFSRDATTLTWTLTVEGIPAEITFDRDGVPTFVAEYSWAADIDSNRDGQHDWQVSATHFKIDGPERTTSNILSIAQVDLWKVEGAAASTFGFADATLIGNTFTFQVEESEDPDLANVTDAAQSSYSTFHQFGPSLSDQCSDHLD